MPRETPVTIAALPALLARTLDPSRDLALSGAGYGWSSEECGLPLAGAARAALDEYLLTLLLHHHSHNYSEELAQSVPTPVPGVLRRAERFIIDKAEGRPARLPRWLGSRRCTTTAGAPAPRD